VGKTKVDTCPKGCLDLSKLDILVFDDIFPTKLADQIIQKFEEDERYAFFLFMLRR
jgi:hypothetical protein